MGKEETVQLLSSTARFQYSSVSHDSEDGSIEENVPSQSNVAKVFDNFREVWQSWEAYCIASLSICLFAIERVCFKATVDLFSDNVLGLWLISIFIAGVIHSFVWYLRKTIYLESVLRKFHDFPHKHCIIVSIFDSIILLGLLYSAKVLTATRTVLYFQFSTAGSVLSSKVVFPARLYTYYHYKGTAIIVIALLVVYSLDMILSPTTVQQGVLGAVFLVFSLTQGLLTVMKQKILIDWLVPIEIAYFNMILSFYQFLTALLLTLSCSLIQEYQGKATFFEFFVGLVPSSMEMLVLITYVGASCALTYSLECATNYDTLLYRSMNVGIFTAFAFTLIYDIHTLTWLSTVIGAAALLSVLWGLEVYNYNPEPESELKLLQQQQQQVEHEAATIV